MHCMFLENMGLKTVKKIYAVPMLRRYYTGIIQLLLSVIIWINIYSYASAQVISGDVPAAKILSPLPGCWGNKQALILDVPDGCDVYYSVAGTNPLESGFAYDGPVFLDVVGDVYLSLVTVSSNGAVSDSVEFSVEEQPIPDVLADFFENPLYEFTPGKTVNLPPNMRISLGENLSADEAYLSAGRFALDASNALERFVPCNIYTEDTAYHFVIHVTAASGVPLAKTDVPIRIEDWEKIYLTNQRYIYSVDGGEWFAASDEPVEVDRSISHIIQWQSIVFDSENPVYRYELPPKPQLEISPKSGDSVHNGAVFISVLQSPGVSGNYMFSFEDSATPVNGVYSVICADILWGEELSETIPVSVYQNSLYQGKLFVSLLIDKKPPRPPVITALDDAPLYSRSAIHLNFTTQEKNSIYYDVQSVEQIEGFDSLGINSAPLVKKTSERYDLLRKQTIELPGDISQAVLYTVFAYAADAAGNKSEPAIFTAIVDRCNYYINPDAEYDENDSHPADGSLSHPFTTFAEVIPIINAQEFTRVYVSGIIPLVSKTAISSDCEIISRDRTVFSFSAEDPIIVRNANVRIKNCAFEYKVNSESSYSQNMFSLKKANVYFDTCNFATVFGSNGVLFDCADSDVLLESCSASVQARIYVSLISGKNCNITMRDSDVSLIGSTTVCFSLNGGSFSLYDTSAKLITRLGRIAELSTVETRLVRNSFAIEFQDAVPRGFRSAAIWKNRMTDILEEKENSIRGFQNFQDTL